eukprot:GHVH01001951.1.p1 GENE.GHVH01001951.1~~GHVH01001951.1.p1  ORF type:complete len:407 (+),score=46.28 GHVH01001951.1:99-1319(+)
MMHAIANYLVACLFVLVGSTVIEGLVEGEPTEHPNHYELLWSDRTLILGPEAGGSHDNDATGRYLCRRLTRLVNCVCHHLPNVRSLSVACHGDRFNLVSWFSTKHHMTMLKDNVTVTRRRIQVHDESPILSAVEDEENQRGTRAWHTDMLDSTSDGHLNVNYSGEGVHLFVMDTGFSSYYERTLEFPIGVRLAPADQHWHPGSDDHDAFFDCNGHGTQVGFLAGSLNRSVAPNVTIHIVRISSCPQCSIPAQCEEDESYSYSSYTFRAIQWIIETVKNHKIQKAIVSRSFSTSVPDSDAYQYYSAAAQILAENDILWVASAGNDNSSRCARNYCEGKPDCPKVNNKTDPIFDDNALIVGAINRDGSRSEFSSYGSCVSQWMYGSGIVGVPPPTNDPPPPIGSNEYK